MTIKEYLHQAYRLDQRIKSDTMEAQNLREMAGSVSAIQYDKDRVQTSRNTEAPFVRTLEKLWTLEKKIAGELEMLSDLKKQIREVIEAVPWYSSTGTSTTIRGSRSEWNSVQMPAPFVAGTARRSFM